MKPGKRHLTASLLVIMLILVVACSSKTAGVLMVKSDVKAADFKAQSVLSLVKGKAQVAQTGSEKWIEGKEGMVVDSGTRIKTGPDSKATVTFFDGTTIEIKSDTNVLLEEIKPKSGSAPKSIRIRQQIGETTSRVVKIVDSASKYEIETPAGIAGVRGSVMAVKVVTDGTTTVYNIEGKISLKAQGQEVIIPAGSGSTARVGEAPGAPQPGLPPGIEAVDPHSISSQKGWQSTGIQLHAGDEFWVEYRGGSWSVDYRNFAYFGPEGYAEDIDVTIARGYKFDSSVPYGYLLGKVGDGSTLLIGSKGEKIRAGMSGNLYLRINDKDTSLGDNNGSITVSVKVRKK